MMPLTRENSTPWMSSAGAAGGDRVEKCQPQRNYAAGLSSYGGGHPRGYSSESNVLNTSPGIYQPVVSGRSGIESFQGTPGGGRIHNLNGYRYGMDREKMKEQLAYTNALPPDGTCGILPGYRSSPLPASTRKGSSSISWNQSQPGAKIHSAKSIVNLMARGRGANNNNEVEGYSRPTLDSRIQDVIDSARSEIARTEDFAVKMDTRRKVPGAWPTMGTPRDGLEELERSADKRQKQEVYRVELERQIEQKNRQKADDQKKRDAHPLGPKYDAPAEPKKMNLIPLINKYRKNDSSVMKKHLLMEKPSVTDTQRIFPHQSPSQSRFPDPSYKQKHEQALMNLRNSRSGPLRSPFTPPHKHMNNYNGNTGYDGGSTSAFINSNPSSNRDFQSNSTLPTDPSQAGLSSNTCRSNNNMPTQQQDYNNNNMRRQAQDYNQDQSQHDFNCNKPYHQNLTLPNNHNQRQNGQSNYPSNNIPMGPAGFHQPRVPPGMPMMQPGINQYPGYIPTFIPPQPAYPSYPPQPGHPSYPPQLPQGRNTMDPEYQYQNQQTNYSNGSFQAQQSGRQPMPQGGGAQYQQGSSPHYGSQEQPQYNRQMPENLNNDGNYDSYRNRDGGEYDEQDRYRNSNKNHNDEYEEDQKLTTKDILGKQKIWQTSDELPDKSVLEQLHKDELKEQIEENKRIRLNRLAKEKAEEEKLERQIQKYHEEQRKRLENERILQEMEPKKQQVRRNDLPPPRPQRQYERQPKQNEKPAVYTQWRVENPESALARKLGNKNIDSSRRNRKEGAQPRRETEYSIPSPNVIRRNVSPPIPTIQRRLVLQAENGTDESKPVGFPIALSKSKMEFFKGLQTRLSKERDSIEKGLKNKLEKSPRHGSR